MAWFQTLSRNSKLILGGTAVLGSYALYKSMHPANTAAAMSMDRRGPIENVATAARVMKEHAKAAVDDVKKEAGEIGSVMRNHATLAKRDVSTAGSEFKKAISGEPLKEITVRDTPPVAVNNVDDSTRQIGIITRQKQQGWEKSPSPSHGPTGYEPATFAESPSERMHKTKYTNNSPIQDGGDIAKVHGELGKRDIKQGSKEVGQALFGDRLPEQIKVRDTPSLVQETPRDRIRKEELDTVDQSVKHHPSIGDRVSTAKEIISRHSSAASEDVKKARMEKDFLDSEKKAGKPFRKEEIEQLRKDEEIKY